MHININPVTNTKVHLVFVTGFSIYYIKFTCYTNPKTSDIQNS